MKTIYITVTTVLTILAFAGCKKEELPPYRCNTLKFDFWAYGQSPAIDSIAVSIVQKGIENGNRLDTMIYNPAPAGFNLNFCGVFKYTVKVYNSAPNLKYIMGITVNSKSIYNEALNDNGIIEGEFMYDGLPY